MEEATSIKQIIGYIVKNGIDDTDVRIGVVVSENPLKIALKNDPKIILSVVDMVVPQEMKKRTKKAHINIGDIPVYTPDGGSVHIDCDAEVIVDDTPKEGETIYMLRYGKGRRYFLLGKG